MVMAREKVAEYLDRFLHSDDRKHLELMVDLCWAAVIAHEFGFYCSADKRAEGKEKLIALIQRLSDARTFSETTVKMRDRDDFDTRIVDEDYKEYLIYLPRHHPTTADLALVCDFFHVLTAQLPRIAKEKMIEWLQDAWDAGVYQQRIHSMEFEGCVMNEFGIVTNFGAILALWGVQKGYLPADSQPAIGSAQ